MGILWLPMKINCNMFTAQNNSNWKDRSCLTLQMQMGTDMRLTKTKGTKTSTQMCLWDSKLSATNSSNIKSSKWVAKLISMALYWMYSSALRWVWGLLHQTIEPMIAPDTEKNEDKLTENVFRRFSKTYLQFLSIWIMVWRRTTMTKTSPGPFLTQITW